MDRTPRAIALAGAACAACALAHDLDTLTDRALDAEWKPARADVLEDRDAFAAVSRRTALSRDWQVLTFRSERAGPAGQGRRDGWRVRRTYGRGGGPGATVSISSRDCPAIGPVLADLEGLRGPLVDAPDVGWERGDVVIAVADGASYRLVADDFQDVNATAWSALELSGASGSALGDWTEETLAALAPCWPPSEPDSR